MTAAHYTLTIRGYTILGARSCRLSGETLRAAKTEAAALAVATFADPACQMGGAPDVVLYVRDTAGAVVDRHRLDAATLRSWRGIGATDAPAATCRRCGGLGRESVMDDHCYACGKRGGNARKHSRSTTGLE
jgi:hypothetical protein